MNPYKIHGNARYRVGDNVVRTAYKVGLIIPAGTRGKVIATGNHFVTIKWENIFSFSEQIYHMENFLCFKKAYKHRNKPGIRDV